MNYLIMNEDLSLKQTDKLTEIMKEECEMGLIDIVDMKLGVAYMGNGRWDEIQKM